MSLSIVEDIRKTGRISIAMDGSSTSHFIKVPTDGILRVDKNDKAKRRLALQALYASNQELIPQWIIAFVLIIVPLCSFLHEFRGPNFEDWSFIGMVAVFFAIALFQAFPNFPMDATVAGFLAHYFEALRT